MVELRGDALRRVELVGPEAADVEAVIVEWFSSPYWPTEHAATNCLTSGEPHGAPPGTPTATLADSHLSSVIGATPPAARIDPAYWSLVDRYVSGPEGAITTDRLDALDAACRPDSATYALLHVGDGHVARSSIAALLALLVAEAVRTSVRYPVHHQITRILGAVDAPPGAPRRRAILAPAGTPIAGIECLVPTTAGRAARAQIAAQAVTAVPVVLYPLVAAVVAEASGVLVPLVNAPQLVGGTTATAIVPATRPQVAAWQLQRSINSPTSVIARTARTTGAGTLAVARRVADTGPAAYALRLLGVDTTRSSGVVTRLRAIPDVNPWASTTFERAALRAPAYSPLGPGPGRGAP